MLLEEAEQSLLEALTGDAGLPTEAAASTHQAGRMAHEFRKKVSEAREEPEVSDYAAKLNAAKPNSNRSYSDGL